jgi:hypothetical protein
MREFSTSDDGCQPGQPYPVRAVAQPYPIRPSVLLGLIEVLAALLVDQAETVGGDPDVRFAAAALSEEIHALLREGGRSAAARDALEIRRVVTTRRAR